MSRRGKEERKLRRDGERTAVFRSRHARRDRVLLAGVGLVAGVLSGLVLIAIAKVFVLWRLI